MFLLFLMRLVPAAAQVRLPSKAQIAAAMRLEKALGYDLLVTANGAQFSSSVILHLARTQTDRPFLLAHREYFDAIVEVSGLTADKLPEFVRIAHRYGEDQYVDPRMERVIQTVVTGSKPRLAMNVVAGSATGKGVAEKYTYRDDAATPPLRVVHKRVSRYRLLEFGEPVLFDEISGVFGRPTGGALGAMFSVIGDGRAWRSLAGYGSDG